MKNFIKTFVVTGALLLLPFFVSAQTAQPTITELQAMIQALMQQIASMQTGGGTTVSPAVPATGTSSNSCVRFASTLREGSTGSQVVRLHTILQQEGFDIDSDELADGYYGETTASAVTGYQEKYRSEVLTPAGLRFGTGLVGAGTRAKLNRAYPCGTIANPITPIPPVELPTGNNLLITNSSTLPAGKVGTPYQVVLGVLGGPTGVSTSNYLWSITSGNLPSGLSLREGATGMMISGTPTSASNSSFTLTTKYAEKSGSKNFTINITDGVTILPPAPCPLTNVGGAAQHVCDPVITSLSSSKGVAGQKISVYGNYFNSRLNNVKFYRPWERDATNGFTSNIAYVSDKQIDFVLDPRFVANSEAGAYLISLAGPAVETNKVSFTISKDTTPSSGIYIEPSQINMAVGSTTDVIAMKPYSCPSGNTACIALAASEVSAEWSIADRSIADLVYTTPRCVVGYPCPKPKYSVVGVAPGVTSVMATYIDPATGEKSSSKALVTVYSKGPIIQSSDSDNSPNYNIIGVSPYISPQGNPDLFVKGVAKAEYYGTREWDINTKKLIFGRDGFAGGVPTNDNYFTHYDNCPTLSQLNEGYIANGILMSIGIQAPQGYICRDGAFVREGGTTGAPVYLSLSPSSPVKQSVKPGQRDVTFAIANLKAGASEIRGVEIAQPYSYTNIADFSRYVNNIRVYDDRGMLLGYLYDYNTQSSSIGLLPTMGKFNIPAYSTRSVTIKADILPNAPSGHIDLGFGGFGAETNYEISGLPVVGNTVSIVSSNQNLEIITYDLPVGKVGQNYLAGIKMTDPFVGNTDGGSVAWGISSGSLPPGISYYSGDKSSVCTSMCYPIGGTPTVAGTYTFTFYAEANGRRVERQFSIYIAPGDLSYGNLYIDPSSVSLIVGGESKQVKGMYMPGCPAGLSCPQVLQEVSPTWSVSNPSVVEIQQAIPRCAVGFTCNSNTYTTLVGKAPGTATLTAIYTEPSTGNKLSEIAQVSVVAASTPVPVSNVIGYADKIACDVIGGWALNMNNKNSSMVVNIYDEVDGYRSMLSRVETTGLRSDVNASYGVTGNHGFTINTPASVKDGRQHKISVMGVGDNLGEVQLSGSPQTITCPVAVASSGNLDQIANSLEAIKSLMNQLFR